MAFTTSVIYLLPPDHPVFSASSSSLFCPFLGDERPNICPSTTQDTSSTSHHHGLGCIFLPESSGFLYFPFRSPVSHRNLNFRSAVILFIGRKRSKNLRSKTKTMGQDHGVPRVPSGTVLQLLRLAIVKSLAATLVLLHA